MRDLDGQLRDLEHRLVSERTELVGGIQVPELGVIRSRARAVRRRRRMAGAAAALALLSVVGAGTAAVLDNRAVRPPEVAASGTPTWTQSVYRGWGLTLYGLTADVDDRPGQIYDIQFAPDGDRGTMLLADCQGDECALSALATSDAGRSWHPQPLPVTSAPAGALPRAVPFGTEQLGLIGGDRAWIWTPGTWTSLSAAAPPAVEAVPKGGRLWTRTSAGCDPGPLYVWAMDGTLGILATPPPMQVCRVAAGAGVWWVGGYDTGAGRRPAVAVSRDYGRHWQKFPLPAAGDEAWAQVAPLGTEVYASVVSPRGGQPYPEAETLYAVYRSVEGGPFRRYGPTNATIVGDVIPLLDGSLLAAGPTWHVSADGDRFRKAPGDLPYVGRFARSPGGWIAYDLFQAGYAAVSRDGVVWHKFNYR
jgi:hypothetical protein